MSDRFRAFVQKIGSGQHTNKPLSRAEAAEALDLMLTGAATPAQIGAFLIAHRIRRPTPEEMAGFLDTYATLGPQLQPIPAPVPPLVFGHPYDGRSRTAPIAPLVALLLAAAGCPSILHGSDRVPTKYGLPLVELWALIGVDWRPLHLQQVQQVFAQTGLAFLYQPQLFPLAESLVAYRDQIGKRPPLATAELLWNPYTGQALQICGFVHPPTEALAWTALQLRGSRHFVTVKGLEGSCDLPRDRAAILGICRGEEPERLILHARDYSLGGPEVSGLSAADWQAAARDLLSGTPSVLDDAVLWNAGIYLWLGGLQPSLAQGLAQAESLLRAQALLLPLRQVQRAIAQAIDANLGDSAPPSASAVDLALPSA